MWERLALDGGDLWWALLRVEPPSRGHASNRLVVEAHGDAPLSEVRSLLCAKPALAFLLLRAEGVDVGAPVRIKRMVFSYLPPGVPFSARIAFGETSKALVASLNGHAFHVELHDCEELDAGALEARLKAVGGAFQCS